MPKKKNDGKSSMNFYPETASSCLLFGANLPIDIIYKD